MGSNGRQYPHSASRVPMVDSIHTPHHGFRPSTMADHTDVNWMERRVGVGGGIYCMQPEVTKAWRQPQRYLTLTSSHFLNKSQSFSHVLKKSQTHKVDEAPCAHTTDSVEWHEQSFPVKPQQLYFSSYINPTLNTALLLLFKPHALYTLIST